MRINESTAGGCAFLDYDNDGWLDVLLIGPDRLGLFHNNHGRFEDVTKQFGLDRLPGYWMGCAVGDVDGDGFPDLLLTGYHCLALLKNEGGKAFKDITRAAGFDPGNNGHWALSAGFMDLDGSGKLSLVLTNYVRFGPKDEQYCYIVPGLKSGCPPNHYLPEYPEIWQNTGGGKFKEISHNCGIQILHGDGMTVAFADIDGSGRMSFYIGNDGKPAELIRNLGGMRFTNVGGPSGVAANDLGHAIAAMGADFADYDGDGKPDLAITAFSDEPYSVYRNRGNSLFEYVSAKVGVAGPTYNALGFGAKWLDVDNDGWPDLAFANGHLLDNAEQVYTSGTTFLQPMMLFHNVASTGGRAFEDIAPQLGGDLERPMLGRGLATGDFDNDGKIDMLVVDYQGAALLLHNESGASGHWVTLDLRDSGISLKQDHNMFAYGATVTMKAGGRTFVGCVSPAGSFLSSSDPRIHFGLGPIAKVDSLTIRWSDGRQQSVGNVQIDQITKIFKAEPPGL